MKKYTLIFIAFLLPQFLIAQINWTYSTNPVLSMDTTVMWAAYGQPTCIIQNDTFKMWYAVASGTHPLDTLPVGRIHYAWSTDGTNWTKYPGNPVMDVGVNGSWDDEWLDTPEILWDGTELKLYYYGDSTYYQGQDNTNIGLATSTDGINWTRKGIVLQKGSPGEWDGKYIESPAAYYDTVSGVYALIYTGTDTIGWIRLGLAVSSDGYNWIKNPTNPVLDHGILGSWDDLFVAVPAMIYSDGVFEMWYSAVSLIGQWDSVWVGYATSLNGTDWIKYPGNPVLKMNPPDTAGFWAVDVVWDDAGNEYKMYYENIYISDASAIYKAEAPRSILFSAYCNTNVSNDTTIVLGDSITLFASGGMYYQWYPETGLNNPNIPNPKTSPDSTTAYRVMIVSDSCITVDTVVITVIPVGIDEGNGLETELKIYPNPARYVVYVSFLTSSLNLQAASFELVDMLGKVIISEAIIQNSKRLAFHVSELPEGIYLVRIMDNESIISKKLIILK
ncbi:T9SS type A sorting domain-containing protein [candidate division KSB1 bacterium]